MTKTKLSKKLEVISAVLPINRILNRQTSDILQIAKYYRKNRLAYRIFNSHDGFVHMGISSGNTFSTTDFYAQAKLIDKVITASSANRVLELAPGKAATTRYLAVKHPRVSFYGIDLPHGQLKATSKLKNLHLSYGDYHDLSHYTDGSMDIVYVIEALCHAANKGQVISEVSRVLRKGGYFIVIDGYFSGSIAKFSTDEQIAIKLVASSMMVTSDQQDYVGFIKMLKAKDFSIKQSTDYSKNILPSLYRLEATAKRFMKRPMLAKALTVVAGELVTANAAAGYLMPDCMENKLFEYRYTLAVKM